MTRAVVSLALATISVAAASSSWSRTSSAIYPYTIEQPSSFRYVVMRDPALNTPADYYFAPAGGEVIITAFAGPAPGDQATLLRWPGGKGVHIIAWLHIGRQMVPLVQVQFRGLAGRWIMARATFAACGLSWSLTMTYSPAHRGYRDVMLRMLRSFRLTCPSVTLA